MRNWIRIYSNTSRAHDIATYAWSTDCTDYNLDYLRFCEIAKVNPLSEKQFNFIIKMVDNQYLKSTLETAKRTRRF